MNDSSVDDSAAAETNAVRSEAREYLAARAQRRHLFPRAALVGFLSGIVALLFRLSLTGGDAARNALYVCVSHYPAAWGWALPTLSSATLTGASVWMLRRWAPEASGSGIPHIEAVLRRLKKMRWETILPVKFLGGVLAIGGAGLALGREGPTVQMGGAVGAGVAARLNSGLRERETLIMAGAGAGLAAAFNAPLAGLVFVLEEVQREFTPIVFGAALVATVIADVVARLATGQEPVFHIPAYAVQPLGSLPLFIVLGAIAGLLGVVFNKSLLVTLNAFARVRRVPAWATASMVGAAVGLVGYFRPDLLGGGHGIAEQALAGHFALTAIPALFLIRFAMTMTSYGCGTPGGIFAPLLVLGALLGLCVGQIAGLAFPHAAVSAGAFAVVGMAAYFTAIVRAPLTGIVLIVEMTGSYALMLPLLAACFSAYAVAEALGNLPIYEALLERDLARGRRATRHGSGNALREPEAETEPRILDVRVQPHAPWIGRRVRDLGLPPGCILVTLRRDGRERAVTADTIMKENDRLVAVVAPQAIAGEEMLRDGCVPG